MKKWILIFCILLLCGCDKKEILEVILYEEVIENEEVKKWLTDASSDIILTEEDILKHNEIIKEKAGSFYNFEETLTKKEIENLITSYQIPSLPRYDTKQILKSDVSTILENRNLQEIKDNFVQKAIVIKRTNLKSFPTSLHFYPDLQIKNFDALQESELPINTPLQILHTSKDELWVFVISPYYAGWVLKEDIAYVTEEDWIYFTQNENFVVITESFLEEYELDMGVTLPYEKYANGIYYLIMPVKGKNDYVIRKTIEIKKEDAYLGYLPYTEKNVYLQAFRYLNTPYGWGGIDGNVDCSSMLKNIYKTFGFVFPRNTSEQRISVGVNIVSLEGKTLEEKRKIIRDNPLSLLYMPGHGMLYLGNINGIDYIIHASGKALKVVETNIENTFGENFLSSIKYINVMK